MDTLAISMPNPEKASPVPLSIASRKAQYDRLDDFYPVTKLPSHLYKYRSLAGDALRWTEPIVVESKLYFASRLQFNDPFDCRPRFETATTAEQRRRFIKEATARSGFTGKRGRAMMALALKNQAIGYEIAIKDAIRHVEDHLDHRIGILCLSARPDDLLMWSHYADSHRGICLTFEGQAGACPFRRIMPVRYQRNLAVCNPALLEAAEVNALAIYTKSDHWAYEQEWRLTSPSGPGTIRFKPELLTEVTLGVSISSASEALIREWVRKHATPIKLRRAVLKSNEYGVSFQDL